MKARRDVFQAIADPTRREIIHIISSKSLNVNSIVEHFDMKRQSITLHLKVLEECGLLKVSAKGREKFFEPQFGKLREVSAWVEQYKQFWETQFNSLEKYLDKVQSDKKKKDVKKRKTGRSRTGRGS